MGRALERLVAASLPDFLARQRWFRSKARRLGAVSLIDWAPLGGGVPAWLTLVEVGYAGGERETYAVPMVARAEVEPGARVIGHVGLPGAAVMAYDAFDDPEFRLDLLAGFEGCRTIETRRGTIRFTRTPAFALLPASRSRSSVRATAEQSNSSIIYDESLILKAFRKVEAGINPDAEVTGFLTTRTRFRNIPLLAGTIDYAGSGFEAALAVLQQFVPNRGDGWSDALEHLGRFLEFVGHRAGAAAQDPAGPARHVREFSAGFFLDLRRLGAVTARLHTALASAPECPAFAPEPISERDAERWTGEIGHQVRAAVNAIRGRLDTLPQPLRGDATVIVREERRLIERLGDLRVLAREGCAQIRIHGDFHLGQTLRTPDDFVILDFEGEPARPLGERRARHCPLMDVAGMLRSFAYAVAAALSERAGGERAEALDVWGETWGGIAREAFLEGYLAESAESPVRWLPDSRAAIERVLAVFEIDKAAYEVQYEINNRPAWLAIPLQGLKRLLER